MKNFFTISASFITGFLLLSGSVFAQETTITCGTGAQTYQCRGQTGQVRCNAATGGCENGFVSGGTFDPRAAVAPGQGSRTIRLANPLHNVCATIPETDNDYASKCVAALVGNIINFLLSIVGAVALLMFVWGGFTWLTAAGRDEKIKKGKEVMKWATFGLAVIFASYFLVRTIITVLTQRT